jgi:hypothetical protein
MNTAPPETAYDHEIHSDAHPVCEGCGATTCLWQGSCDCNPAPVYVERLPFCPECAGALSDGVPVAVEEPETTPIPAEPMVAMVFGGGR